MLQDLLNITILRGESEPVSVVLNLLLMKELKLINKILDNIQKKRKKNIEKQTGYKFVDEAISKDDMKQIKKEIRKEVSDILFDIWVKRSSWGGK